MRKIRKQLGKSLLQILEFVRYSSVRCDHMPGFSAHVENEISISKHLRELKMVKRKFQKSKKLL